MRPIAVHDDFENLSLPSCCEPDVRVKLKLTNESGQLSPVAPGTRSGERTQVMVVTGRSTDPDSDDANVGHRLCIWMDDGETARRTHMG